VASWNSQPGLILLRLSDSLQSIHCLFSSLEGKAALMHQVNDRLLVQ
jgi:hypothetical protein